MEVESKEEEARLGLHPAVRESGDLHRRRRTKCICLSVVGVLLALALLILILSLTVFKAKRPVTTITSISLANLDLSLNILRLSVSLNVTLDASISVYNPNKVGFKFTNSSAFVRYRGDLVAEAPIPAGKIGADDSTSMNLTITVLADRLISNPNVYSDIIAGSLPLTTSTRIAGKVRILNCINVGVVSYTTCDLNVDVSSRSIRNQTCHYRTKF